MLHLPAELQLLGAVTTAGAAMISDWDHPRATVVHALPPLTEWMSRGIRHVAGGHRRGTHSLVGIAAFTAIATAAASIQVPIAGHVYTPGQGVIAAFLAAVAAKALRLLPNRGWRAAWALGILVAVSATVLSDGLWWIPASVAVGVSVHILGDALTNNGVGPALAAQPGASRAPVVVAVLRTVPASPARPPAARSRQASVSASNSHPGTRPSPSAHTRARATAIRYRCGSVTREYSSSLGGAPSGAGRARRSGRGRRTAGPPPPADAAGSSWEAHRVRPRRSPRAHSAGVSSRLRILPVAVLGSPSRTVTVRGYL